MNRPPTSARTRAGYTMIELMVVVSIIGASVLAFAPGIGRANADRKVSTAARELIRLGRRARSESLGYLRAHLLWITPDTGRVQLLRAPTNSCRFAAWATIQADCGATPRGDRCLDDFQIASWGAGTNKIKLFEELTSGASPTYGKAARGLCYDPAGVVWYGTGGLALLGNALTSANAVNGGFVYTLHSGAAEPTSADRIHRVLFPLGSSPRSWR